jgi:hypothetical protein
LFDALSRPGPKIAVNARGCNEAKSMLFEILQECSAGGTALQIVYPATQDQPKRVRLLIEKIAEAFSSSAATAPAG